MKAESRKEEVNGAKKCVKDHDAWIFVMRHHLPTSLKPMASLCEAIVSGGKGERC
jgi:hypothetical protein